jgi:hypothetical protein
VVKAKKTADPALKYYFEMLGLPLTASEKELKSAYKYFEDEQAPAKYVSGSAEQKKAEERQAELKFAYEKLAKYFEDNPDTNVSTEENFRFDGNSLQWKEHQAKRWNDELKDFRAKETEVWKSIQDQRKNARLYGFLKRTRIMLTTVCVLAFSGEHWHQDWNKTFRTMQSQTLVEQVAPDFLHSENLQDTHDKLIRKAYDLKTEWQADEESSRWAVIWTWILAVAVVLCWLPKQAWQEINAEIQKLKTKKKVA